jgi:hypothetical protein
VVYDAPAKHHHDGAYYCSCESVHRGFPSGTGR